MAKEIALWDRLNREHETREVYRQALKFGCEYLSEQRERAVFPVAESLEALASFDEPLPEQQNSAQDLLKQLHLLGSPATTAQGGGRYFGFVNGGVLPAALAARLLADVWDQNAALEVMSPIAAKLEAVCERWLVGLFGLPERSAAGFVSGTSTATLCGLLAGRNQLLRQSGWDVSENGLFGAPGLRVVTSDSAHVTVRKALAILGIGAEQIETAPADPQGRFDPSRLPALDERDSTNLAGGQCQQRRLRPFRAALRGGAGSGRLGTY